MSADVQQINNAVQEANELAKKNKDSIEGLAEESGSLRYKAGAGGLWKLFCTDGAYRTGRSCLHAQTG